MGPEPLQCGLQSIQPPLETPTMAVKPRKNSVPPNPATDAVSLHAPTHNIWLAGLGALASAQADAQAEGAKAFESLVEQGLAMQARTQALAKEQWSEATQRMGSFTAGATGTAGSWDRLGGIFEGRVARALASMGIPPACEFAALEARVSALEQALKHLAQATAPATAADAPTRGVRRKARKPL